VFASDLRRAPETAEIAFDGSPVPMLMDWRLRECDYGKLNGTSAADVHAHRPQYLDRPYPDGESWRAAVARVGRFLGDLPSRWEGKRVLVIDHVATRWGLGSLCHRHSAGDARRTGFRVARGLGVPAGLTGSDCRDLPYAT